MLTLVLIGVLAGAVTAVSPCVLPVLPVVFFGAGGLRTPGPESRNDDPGRGGTVGTVQAARQDGAVRIVAGLALSFAILTLAGSLVVTALHLPAGVLRWAGLIVLFLAGLGLVVPAVQRVLRHPFSRLPQPDPSRAGGPFVLGLALGAVYVPCAGPVIAAIAIAGAASQVNQGVLVLTAAFSIGTAIPLLLFAYAGQQVGARASRVRAGSRRFRVTGGVVMITLAVALTVQPDRRPATVGARRYTASVQDAVEGNAVAQQALQELTAPASAPGDTTVDAVAPGVSGPVVTCQSAAAALANCGPAPDLIGIDTWINTQDGTPVTIAALKGKVVLVDFWTFACVNCQHVLPAVTAWYDTYHDAGLEVIGVHTPEFAFEHDPDNVRDAVIKESIHYPVGLDNSSATWQNYRNSYWPAAYLIDATGTLRYVKYGEGDYQHTETLIRQLLVAANPAVSLPPPTSAPAS